MKKYRSDNMKIEKFVLGMVGTNCYIVSDEATKECFIVDIATYSPEMIGHIRKMELQVKGVLLTHGHFDHIMGVQEFVDEIPTTVYAHEEEAEYLKDPQLNFSISLGRREYTLNEVEFLQENQIFELAGFKIEIIHVPGHTSGGCAYYLPDEGVVFTGDTLFNGSVGRTDFPGGDSELLLSSIKEKLLTLPEDTKVYPGHVESTSIGKEKKVNPYFR
jgi:glyoxylase-like metal-dependent hydrolase (beta-lactamase superfamily II)